MRINRRKRKRRIRVGTLLILLTLTVVLLVSCVAGSNVLWVRGLLGFDVTDYAGEPVVAELPSDGETARSLEPLILILAAERTDLVPFEGSAEAVSLYRDEILFSMLRENYSLYTGNAEAIERVRKSDPTVGAITLIPESDFENLVYRVFGGNSVSRQNGEWFTCLKSAGYYTTPICPGRARVTVQPIRLEETLHTYRLTFTLTDGETVSPVTYRAVFVKRDGNDCYFRSLSLS